jgi:hypothetical protein
MLSSTSVNDGNGLKAMVIYFKHQHIYMVLAASLGPDSE